MTRHEYLKRSKQFNGEVVGGMALGAPYALCDLTDPDTGETRRCWVELGLGFSDDTIWDPEHVDDGERLGDWGDSAPGDWVGRDIVTPLTLEALDAGVKFLWTWSRR